MNPETVENPKDYDQGSAVPIPQVGALPNMDYSGDSDLSTPNMDTEHTPVETPIKTPVRVPNIRDLLLSRQPQLLLHLQLLPQGLGE